MSWVTDIMHFSGILDPDTPAPPAARNIACFFGSIVQTATAWPPGDLLESAIPCRRRPGHQACPGRIRLVLVAYGPDGKPIDDVRIVWECPVCKDNGIIRNWHGTTWDLSEVERDADFWDSETLDVNLSNDEYLALREALSAERSLLALVIVSRSSDRGPIMEVTVGEVRRLVTGIVEAKRTVPRNKGRHLDSALGKLHRHHLDDGQVQ